MGWEGQLKLQFCRQGDQTLMIDCYTQAPLKVQRPFYPEGTDLCHGVILHTAGGVAAGDQLHLSLDLQARSQVLLTTTAASKLYGHATAAQPAQQKLLIQVAQGATLEWLPQETIVFNGAYYNQQVRVDLAPGAQWLAWEMTRFGRSAQGETFQTGHWRSHTEVWQHNQRLWVDPQELVGGSSALQSAHGLASQPVVASLVWLGTAPTREQVQAIRQLWTASPRRGEAGVSQLMQGLVCRYRGPATQEARQWFVAIWQLLRPTYLQRPACLPRAWGV